MQFRTLIIICCASGSMLAYANQMDKPGKTNDPAEKEDDSLDQIPDDLHDAPSGLWHTIDQESDPSDLSNRNNLEEDAPSSSPEGKPTDGNSEDASDKKKDSLPNSEDVNFIKIHPHDDPAVAQQAHQLFEEGMRILNKTGRRKSGLKLAMKHITQAANLHYIPALEQYALATLLGDGVSQNLAMAFDKFQLLANEGNPRGQFGVGFLYAVGLKVNSSQAHALLYLTFAALGGDYFAQMALAYRYWAGLGVEASCETALTYYQKVASQVADQVSLSGGPAIHRIRIIDEVEYMNQASGGATSSANSLLDDDLIQYYQFLAEKGDANAQVGLGQIYFHGGRGVEVDYKKALRYLNMAAKAGNSNAMALLGKMYVDGGGDDLVASNATALDYFERATQAGNAMGMSGLGIMHMHGRGVTRDYAKALKYFSMAADQGWVEGQLYMGILHLNGFGVKRDYKTALKYFNLAAQHGNVLAYYNLAQMHATGTGVMRSCNTAAEFYKNVAERGRWGMQLMEAHSAYIHQNYDEALIKYLLLAEMGYEVAQSNVAYLLDQGKSKYVENSHESYKRALLYWQRSANQGNSVSRVKVGDYYYYGWGTEVNYAQAAQQYRLASDQQHNPQAIFNLGYMHERGLGIKQDIHLAKRFYDLAAEASTDAMVPVTLALSRLSFYFVLEYLRDWSKMKELPQLIHPGVLLGPRWDFFLLPFLLGGLFLVIVLLQRRRHHPHAQ